MRALTGFVLVVAVLTSVACHTMTAVPLSELSTLKPSHAWFKMHDSSVVEVSGPHLKGDTVVGYVRGEYEQLPTANVTGVTVQKVATGKTAALVTAGLVAFGGFAYLIASSASHAKDTTTVDCDVNPAVCM